MPDSAPCEEPSSSDTFNSNAGSSANPPPATPQTEVLEPEPAPAAATEEAEQPPPKFPEIGHKFAARDKDSVEHVVEICLAKGKHGNHIRATIEHGKPYQGDHWRDAATSRGPPGHTRWVHQLRREHN
ncbi:hypothetical protein CYMTET_44960 [Cymbomonas tetramitiformis]|uniref:Uncharacterized protein n=1 Tax=Cymbomonas tetramitiformis TaxID=36881 RepID=A0AAE0F062_9CHLO|nr:hypothetical protein CYMTET_44960 [Cymbomonas tetramitiformis]